MGVHSRDDIREKRRARKVGRREEQSGMIVEMNTLEKYY